MTSEVSDALTIGEAGASSHRLSLAYDSIEEAFPEVNPGLGAVFGDRVMVQIRSAMRRTRGGIELPEESRETEHWNTQVAKVLAVGPAAFKNRDTLERWPEGEWCSPGEYVRVPKYGGDRWEVPHPTKSNEKILIVVFKDLDLIGGVTDPLAMVAYI